MNKFYIFNEANEELKKETKILKKVLKYAIKHEKLKNVEFNIIYVDIDKIHEINREYRNIDRPTDVISFALQDNEKIEYEKKVLGDIYICLDKAHSQSEEYGHDFLRELCFLAVHGFYHLLGYDHQTKKEEEIMFAKQEEILEKFKIVREVNKMDNNIKRNKDKGNALERYIKSFFHAVDGIVYAIEKEHNMLIIMVAAILVMILSVILPISMTELMIVVILVALVMAFEFINTAIEATIDLISTKEHPLAKIAKDTASSATLVLSVASLICGIIIFLPKILALF